MDAIFKIRFHYRAQIKYLCLIKLKQLANILLRQNNIMTPSVDRGKQHELKLFHPVNQIRHGATVCSRRAWLVSTGAACFIASCTQVEKAYETVKTAALSGFEWISERTKDLGDMVMGRVEPPEDDGSACHAPERLSFYESVSQIRAAQRAQYGAAAALVGATLGAIYFKSTLAKLAVAGFGVAMAKILHDIAEDRKLTVDLTGGFETLVDCRRTAARKVNAGVVTGKLTRAEAQSEMEAIRTSLQEDIEVAEGANHILSVRTESFSVNAERLNKEAEPPANEQEAAERVEEDKKVQAALQTNQNVLNQQVTTIAEAKDFEQSIGGFDTV